jgi:hypothetical protein
MSFTKTKICRVGHYHTRWILLFAASLMSAHCQQIRVLSASIVTSDGGPHEWYTVQADPENAKNLITCGMMWNARDNADYGFVYSSQDGGVTWSIALEDKSSKDVSEESCAFGVHGVVYFVADAWKQDEEGNVIWPEAGTTRIWVSHDSGKTWSMGTTGGWTDFSASVVDQSSGPNQNRLYVFFNNLRDYFGSILDHKTFASLPQLGEHAGSSTGLISFRDGDQKIAGPVFNLEMYKELYGGSYPSQILILKDGSLLTFFWAKKRLLDSNGRRNGREMIFAAQRTDAKRESISAPVVLFRVPNGAACDLSAAATYDATTNAVYATYLDSISGRCDLILTKSTDDGQTWSPGHSWTEVLDPEAKSGQETIRYLYSSLALARNHEGVMALLWRKDSTSNCWYFAVSTDDGQTYARPMQISSCSPEADGQYHLSDAYLGFWGLDQADESKPADNARLMLNNSYNLGESHVSGIAVSPDGVFHPVWNISVTGEGQLRTAAIAVIKPRDRNAPEPPRTDGWLYKTNEIKFLYGGSQHYDATKGILTESVIVRNSGTEMLKAPLRLEISPDSRLGRIWPLDVTTEGSGQNIAQYLEINQYLPGGELAPGRCSAPIPLNFHFELYNDAKPDNSSLAHISVRLLTKEAK